MVNGRLRNLLMIEDWAWFKNEQFLFTILP